MKKEVYISIEGVVLKENFTGNNALLSECTAGIFYACTRIVQETVFDIYFVNNANISAADSHKMISIFANQGIIIKAVVTEEEVILKATNNNSLIVISSASSSTFKHIEPILFHNAPDLQPAVALQQWSAIISQIKAAPRLGVENRITSETAINILLNLDGTGKGNIDTGLHFFNHMLEQISRHGQFDLDIKVKGDLHIDEHHTIEDVGLALGTAFTNALGIKKGIERYGFLLPMDDCLAQVAIDFGGRPWLVWDAGFTRERIGDVPTEMFFHFFKSFSDNAKCNLNIKAEGENEHHKIESIFKAFAKAIRMAVAATNNFSIPSTKGVI